MRTDTTTRSQLLHVQYTVCDRNARRGTALATTAAARGVPHITMTALARTQRSRPVWLPGATDTAHNTP